MKARRGIFRGAHASRVLVAASRGDELPHARIQSSRALPGSCTAKVCFGGTPKPARGTRALPGVRGLALLAALSLLLTTTLAQDKPADDLTAKSLPFRTALFHDPTLAPPVERLLQLYGAAGRVKELTDLYRQHVAQFPADTGALTILVRLLAATNDPEAGKLTRQAAQRLPDNAYLQFLLFEHLQKTREAGALDALDRAIAKETLPTRKRAWIERLLPLATAEGRAELAQKHLETLATESRTAEEKIDVARKMMAQKLDAAALAVLESAAALTPAAETGVEIELAAASAELALKKPEAAAQRLDRLLGRLAADYWRRAEILHRRTALVKSDAERETMLAAARARWKAAPGDESAALEVAQLLTAFEFRREALDILLDAATRIPGSEKIEKTALELFDRLRDERGREAFLAARLRAAPDRLDLALACTRSLFVLNRRDEALAIFDPLAEKLEPAARLTQLLELARFLRRSALSAPAAEIFGRAVALAPARLDVRRELAEMWLVLGEKAKARAVFTGPLPAETETENLLDVIQFLLKQDLVAEADAALAAKVEREPQNFDLRLVQLTVAIRRADQTGGLKLLETTRTLADTDARYRRWLEAAVTFHETFETDAEFLAAQQARVAAETDAWTPAKLDRTLAFVEVAATHGRKTEMAALLQSALAGDLAPELRVELRRRHFALVENDPAQSATVEKQLQALLTDDPARADEYRIRLALHYSRMKRSDQVAQALSGGRGRGMLAAIDLKKVTDAALLTALENILREFGGDQRLHLQIAERLTVIEPANRGAWERWTSALAMSGDEDRLRAALRRLLGGIDKLPLTDETRAVLEAHLLASQWRSLHLLLRAAEQDDARLPEVLPLLEEVGRNAKRREEWLWLAWTRAYTLNRLGRTAARDAAIAELDRVAALPLPKPAKKPAEAADSGDEETPPTADIVFPDGLVIGLKQARALLTAAPAKAPVAPAPPAIGPRGALRVRWAFDTDRQGTIVKVLPLDGARLLVADSANRLYCVDAPTGKLLWARAGGRVAVPQPDANGNYGGNGRPLTAPLQPVAAGARIFLPVDDAVECWSAEDGRLLWRAPLLRGLASVAGVLPALFVHADRLLVCDPVAFSVASLDSASGKRLWQRDYPRRPSQMPLNALNSGASFSDGRVLLYGNGAVIVSAADGELAWSFDAGRVPAFPVALADAPVSRPISRGGSRWSGQQQSRQFQIDYLQQRGQQYNNYGGMQPGTTLLLANSAAAWAGEGYTDGQQRFGLLAGPRLLLFQSQSQTLRTVRLDLPFGGGSGSAYGMFVGLAGRRVGMLGPGALSVWDMDADTPASGTSIQLPESALDPQSGRASASPIPLSVAVDGALLYVSGPGGLGVYHARSGQRVQKADWPAGLVPAPVVLAPGVQQQQQNDSTQYYPQGRLRYSNNNNSSALEPNAAIVSDGVFYTPVTGTRLVALVGEEKEPAK